MAENQSLLEKGWNFDNSYTRLPGVFYSSVNPTPVRDPKLVIINEPLADFLGLNKEELHRKDGAAELAGNQIPPGASPIAQAYAGHQFGHFTMLGDGRAILLGEQITPLGARYDIQLKGSGITPYSRRGDGRAALGPMLREYIISEAMYGLGIPTTRSLAVVATGEKVYRETELPGAILTRIAASHIRVGTFQYISKWGSKEELKALTDYSIERHYPEVKLDEKRYLSFLKAVINRQAALIAKWQLVGFIHGVMNTDNMTISGETIDYGPCAFMDNYDLSTVFSSIDTQGRYAYGNQPAIGVWNLARLADTLLVLIHENQAEAIKLAEEALTEYTDIYYNHWIDGMRHKLGIMKEEKEDENLIETLLNNMQKYRVDYTNTFRALTLEKNDDNDFFNSDDYTKWYNLWQTKLERQQESKETVGKLMRNSNPAVIPRNFRVEEALEAANNGDYQVMIKLLNVLSSPYSYTDEQAEYTKPPEPAACPYKTFCGT